MSSFLDLDPTPPTRPVPAAPASSIPAQIGYGAPPQFGAERDADAYAAECSAAADAQSADFVVRPRCHITTPAGIRLEAGAAVDLAAVGGDVRALRELVRLRVVSHVADAGRRVARPEAGRFQMSPHLIGSVMAHGRPGGVFLSAGQFTSPEDFHSSPPEPAVEAMPAHLDPALGLIVPASAARPARAGVRGMDSLIELCTGGACIDLEGEHLPDRSRVSANVSRGQLRPAALVGRFRPAAPEAEPAAPAPAAPRGGAQRRTA